MKTGTLLRLCRVQLAARKTPNGYSLYIRFTENGKQHKQTIGFAPKSNPEAQRRMLEQAKIVAQQIDATLTAKAIKERFGMKQESRQHCTLTA